MFDTSIILYLFLGGAGAGACLVLAVAGLFVPGDRVTVSRSGSALGTVRPVFLVPPVYRKLFAPTYGCALIVLLLGIMCLVADLGRADRLLLLLTTPTFSHIAVGAYAYAACFVLALVLALSWSGVFKNVHPTLVRMCEVLIIPVAVVVMVYTGLLLQSLGAVPLWSVFWLPVVFVLSSVSCGAALVVGIAHFGAAATVFRSLFRRILLCDAIVIVLEAIAVAAFLVVSGGAVGAAPSGTAEAAVGSYTELVVGANAGLWWIGFILVGLVVPLICEIVVLCTRSAPRGLVLAISACVLVGGFVMRFCIVEAGMRPVLAFAAGG